MCVCVCHISRIRSIPASEIARKTSNYIYVAFASLPIYFALFSSSSSTIILLSSFFLFFAFIEMLISQEKMLLAFCVCILLL